MQVTFLDTYLDQLKQSVASLGEVNAEVVALKLHLGWIFSDMSLLHTQQVLDRHFFIDSEHVFYCGIFLSSLDSSLK